MTPEEYLIRLGVLTAVQKYGAFLLEVHLAKMSFGAFQDLRQEQYCTAQ